jgi:two-component system, cell cycle sensor histidine kinase and response regulator CckA
MMKYRLQDLIDIDHFQNLQDRLNKIYSFPSSIIDNDGKILTATAWQEVCARFHRKNEEAEQICIKSDLYILNHLHEANPAVSYRCPHGLVDNATPIIIEGIHYGNFFTGQFFLEQPDFNFFRALAKKYGFDETSYIAAIEKVPIWTQEQLENYLFFIKGLIAIISESGLKRLKEIEHRKKIEQSEKRHQSILRTAMDGFWLTHLDGRLLEVNDTYCTMSGYSENELLSMRISDLEANENGQQVAEHIGKLVENGSDRFESRHRRKDGMIFEVEVSAQFRADGEGKVVCFIRDITEKKLAYNRLIESENKYRKLVESTNAIAWEFDLLHDRWTYVAPQSETVLGFAPHEWTDLDFWRNRIHPKDRENAVEYCNIMTARGEDHILEYRFLKKNNDIIWIRDIVQVEGDNGKAKHLNGFMFEITELKQAEEALYKSEQRLIASQKIARMGDFTWDVDTGEVTWSDALFHLLGFDKSENINYSKVNSQIHHPDDLERVTRWLNECVASKEVQLSPNEYRIVHKDGQTIHVRTVGIIQRMPGASVKVFATVQDITERKEAEQALRESEARFRTIVEKVNDGSDIHDAQGKIMDVNENACKMLGYTRQELLGASLGVIDGPKNTRQLHQRMQILVEHDDIIFEGEHVRKDGQVVPVEISSKCVDREGAFIIQSFVRDVTDRKRAEKKQQKLQEQLAQAQKMESIGRLAGGVAHDFNNNLGVILGNAELALDGIGDSSHILYDHLIEIQEAARRSADLTRQLLAFARKQTIAPRVININTAVQGMLKMLERLIGEDINLVWLPDKDIWPINIDPSQVDQLLANLCVNARDAIDGVGKIIIETSNISFNAVFNADRAGFIPGDYVVIAITDNGVGMGRDVREHLFEPFFTTKGVGQGTGLGLATVYGIVNQNRGFIDVDSNPGKGTVFNIYLPRHEGLVVSEPVSGKDIIQDGQNMTVLLVEDEPAILKVAHSMLRKLGYRVLSATKISEAIRAATEHEGKIDLLITDVIMPEMNGRDLAAQLQQLNPELKVLFMSGYTADVIAHQGILDEGTNFIQKPFTIRSIADKIKEMLKSETRPITIHNAL